MAVQSSKSETYFCSGDVVRIISMYNRDEAWIILDYDSCPTNGRVYKIMRYYRNYDHTWTSIMKVNVPHRNLFLLVKSKNHYLMPSMPEYISQGDTE